MSRIEDAFKMQRSIERGEPQPTVLHKSSRSAVGSAPGLTKRGEPMPQTVDEWKYLAGLYEKQILEDKETISKLKQRNNVLEQRNWR